MEAKIWPKTDVKGRTTLESPLRTYGPHSSKRNVNAKSVFTRLGSTIDWVHKRLRSIIE